MLTQCRDLNMHGWVKHRVMKRYKNKEYEELAAKVRQATIKPTIQDIKLVLCNICSEPHCPYYVEHETMCKHIIEVWELLKQS